MMIIQLVHLYWTKEVRGAPYSSERNRMAEAYALPAKYFEYSVAEFREHYVCLHQTKDGFGVYPDTVKNLKEKSCIKVGSVELVREDQGVRVVFAYSGNVGLPVRTFKDRLFKESFCAEKNSIGHSLVETAGVLKENEYARVMYNGRHISFDCVWYTKEIVNVLNISGDEKVPLDILVRRKPDVVYKQFEWLY